MSEASILIVDDEAGIVRLCTRLLERANYQVEGTSDPTEGVALLSKETYDMLLVDIRMPGMDGFEIIKEARKFQPDIGVVIMTGFGTLETAIRALKQGADGLILKPFEKGEDLVTTIRDAIEERQQKQEIARLKTIRPLLNISESLFSETRYDVLVDLVLNAILGHLRCQNAAIYLRKGNESKISLIKSTGTALSNTQMEGGGLVSRADEWKIPVWFNREGPGEVEVREVLRENDLSATILFPIIRDENTFIFYAARASDEPVFQVVDVEMLGLLARQADIALENARLYEELREYVSQIERSQRALIQAEKMSAVGRLTASIAHEINNPLQGVQNCLHLSEREELSMEDRAKYMGLAKEELDRLMYTVKRMLDFYRPGALQRENTDLKKIVETVLALLDKQLSDQEIEVEKKFEANIPTVRVVKNQIQQVIFNLILNAMEAIGKKGKITIEICVEKKSIIIYVKDDGPGVPKEIEQNIFEPFSSMSEDGTGLGLSVSYGILTAHNGVLELVESYKEGACFKISLPLEETI